MEIEQLLIELMNEAGTKKHEAVDRDAARYYAILFTEIEKMYAFYLVYLAYGASEPLEETE